MAHNPLYRPLERPQTPPLALRPIDAAASIGISPSTLERLTRSGEIASVLIGRCRVYEVETLREYLRDRRQTAEGGAT